MEAATFLANLEFLVALSRKDVGQLSRRYRLHAILDSARICFQSKRQLVYFSPPLASQSQPTEDNKNGRNQFDHTQLKLEVIMLKAEDEERGAELNEEVKQDGVVDSSEQSTDDLLSTKPKSDSAKGKRKRDKDATGIVLVIEGRYYLMDHTAIGSVSIPLTDKERGEPASLYFWMPGVEMRWYLDPSKATEEQSSALVQLREAIHLMNDYLEPTLPGDTPEVRALLPVSKAMKGLDVGTQDSADSATSTDSNRGHIGGLETGASAATPVTSQEVGGSGEYTGALWGEKEGDVWAVCRARLQGATDGWIASTNGVAEALNKPVTAADIACSMLVADSRATTLASDARRAGGAGHTEHLSRMRGKYSAFASYLVTPREPRLPVSSGASENQANTAIHTVKETGILSAREAVDLELGYSWLLSRSKGRVEEILNKHYEGPSKDGQKDGKHHEGLNKDGQKEIGGGHHDLNAELERFAALTEEAALLRSLPRGRFFYEGLGATDETKDVV